MEFRKSLQNIWEAISTLNDSNLLEFLNDHVSKNIIQEGIDNNISFLIVSGYGGTPLGEAKVSELPSLLKSVEDKELNRNYYLIKNQ